MGLIDYLTLVMRYMIIGVGILACLFYAYFVWHVCVFCVAMVMDSIGKQLEDEKSDGLENEKPDESEDEKSDESEPHDK